MDPENNSLNSLLLYLRDIKGHQLANVPFLFILHKITLVMIVNKGRPNTAGNHLKNTYLSYLNKVFILNVIWGYRKQ